MTARPSDRWIPWTFVGGMVLVIVVNAVMVWFALSTFTGTTVDRAYERGRLYNEVIAEAERQARLGWRFSVLWEADASAPLSGRVVLQAADKGSAPLDRLSIDASVLRPLEAPEPLSLGFTQVAPGRYVAPLVLPKPGQWEVRLEARRGAEGPVDHRQRFVAR
ncbi:MAG: FixH family protein [Acetobacteraceae bacterium]|jgi:nitrogen fixation protein FixH|nr:FixH family protein [Acetobacteraceae bacterium]